MKVNKWSSSSNRRLNQLPRIIKHCWARTLIRSPFDITIPNYGALRSEEEQALLYANGKSKCDGVNDYSFHMFGSATDFSPYVDGKNWWGNEKNEADATRARMMMATIASIYMEEAGKEGLSTEWGGNWSSWKDWPHTQHSYLWTGLKFHYLQRALGGVFNTLVKEGVLANGKVYFPRDQKLNEDAIKYGDHRTVIDFELIDVKLDSVSRQAIQAELNPRLRPIEHYFKVEFIHNYSV